MNNFLSKKKNRLYLLFITAPFFLWLMFSPLKVFGVWGQIPEGLIDNLGNIFAKEKLVYIEEVRWDSFSEEKGDFASIFFYNKATSLTNDFFDYLSFFAPHMYFQAGDGREYSTKGVEPIAGILFTFWIAGIVWMIKENKIKILISVFLVGLFAYVAGQKNAAVLFPIYFIYLYIAHLGIEKTIKGKKRTILYKMIATYSIYLIGRALWLT